MPRITIHVPEKTPQPYRFQLDRETVTFGRGSDNDIAIDSGSVSVKHAEMRRVPGGYTLVDVGSTNGIKLDGERTPEIALRNGLAVTLGDVGFDFLLSDEESDELARESKRLAEQSQAAAAESQQDEDEDEPKRARVKAPPRRKSTVVVHPVSGGGGGFALLLLFLILAAAAFFAGMAIRYQKDTGNSLIDAIRAKNTVLRTLPPVR